MDTVNISKLDNFEELSDLLKVENKAQRELVRLFRIFGFQHLVSQLKCEKKAGISVVTLLIALLITRLWGKTIHAAQITHFNGLLSVDDNTFYRFFSKPEMNWRSLMTRVVGRFFTIIAKYGNNVTQDALYYILDDTTLKKTGATIEGVSRVFDHVSKQFILGYKLLTLAISDGTSPIAVDFSLHRERGKNGNYGLTDNEARRMNSTKRSAENPDYQRLVESEKSKIDTAITMLKNAWKNGIRAKYLLADSWFFSATILHAVRSIGNGSVHYLGLAKLNRTRYLVNPNFRIQKYCIIH